jgi:hypothetical protein
VDEYVLAAAFRGNETETLVGVEKLYSPFCHMFLSQNVGGQENASFGCPLQP